jgi:hypothetical protein
MNTTLSLPIGLLAASGSTGGVEAAWTAAQWGTAGAVAAVLGVLLLSFTYGSRAGIIARATTKEAVRQPVFLLLMAISIVILLLNTWIPFFSLGDDVKMLKDCGLATILIAGLLMAIWTSSTSVAEEIEGKTAMTLLSKPINRRQFVVGKYVGIMNAVGLMLLPIALCFLGLIFYKVGYDARESGGEMPIGAERWPVVLQIVPGLIMIFLEVGVLAAISVAISTRLPMVVNMVTCFSIFVIGHLTPVLVEQNVLQIEFVSFMARVIAVILPHLEIFNMQTAVATGAMVPVDYLGYAILYCAAYSTAAIVLGFILFEGRDLA